MPLVYDQQTDYSRLMVWYDRYGLTVRNWCDEVSDESSARYTVSEGFFTWKQYRERERCYSGDDGSGKLKSRLVAAAISLMGYWGPSRCGEVNSLREYINGGHVFTC